MSLKYYSLILQKFSVFNSIGHNSYVNRHFNSELYTSITAYSPQFNLIKLLQLQTPFYYIKVKNPTKTVCGRMTEFFSSKDKQKFVVWSCSAPENGNAAKPLFFYTGTFQSTITYTTQSKHRLLISCNVKPRSIEKSIDPTYIICNCCIE
jgi:hypothetical protein